MQATSFSNKCSVLPSPFSHHHSIYRLLDESYVPLDPSTLPSSITSASDTTTKQLWLFQVPLDFEIGRQVTWKLNSNNNNYKNTNSSKIDSIKANCLIDGVHYQLTSDQDLPSARLFAIAPGSGGSGPIPIVKKLTVSRKTDAQRICFGIGGGGEEAVGGGDDDDGAGKEEEEEEEVEKKSKKRRKKKEDGNGGDSKKRKKRKSQSMK